MSRSTATVGAMSALRCPCGWSIAPSAADKRTFRERSFGRFVASLNLSSSVATAGAVLTRESFTGRPWHP